MTWITRGRRGAAAAQMKHLNSFGNLGKIVKAVAALGCGLDAMAGLWQWTGYLSLNSLLQRREVPNCFRSDRGSGSALLARDEAPRPTFQVRTNQIGRPKPSGRRSALSPDNIFDFANFNSGHTKGYTATSSTGSLGWHLLSQLIPSVISVCSTDLLVSLQHRISNPSRSSKPTRPQHHPRIDRTS
jgi:hypothetical protein